MRDDIDRIRAQCLDAAGNVVTFPFDGISRRVAAHPISTAIHRVDGEVCVQYCPNRAPTRPRCSRTVDQQHTWPSAARAARNESAVTRLEEHVRTIAQLTCCI